MSKLSSVDLYCAMMMGEIVPYYQPLIDVNGYTLYGLEILMRWSLADETMSTESLIHTFDEQGMLPEMTQHLLKQVASDINELDPLFPQGMHLAFNVSPQQVGKPGFVFDTLSFLAALPLDNYQLAVEITEDQPLNKNPEVTSSLLKLRLAGVDIYLDDFGTGYANLSSLAQFCVDGVKIDRLFIDALSTSGSAASIVNMLAHYASKHNLRLIAEGVETAEQSHLLSEIGIVVQQGFYFSRALSKEQLQNYLIAGPDIL